VCTRPIYVLSRMVNNLVRVIGSQTFIRLQGIGVESRVSGDVLANFILQNFLTTARNDSGANFAALALTDSHDRSFIFAASASDAALALRDVHVPSLAADEGFVHFDFAANFRTEEIILHRKANALQHEPCGLLGNFHIAGDLVAANSILAVSKHPRCPEPLVQCDRAIFVDRPNLDGELALRVMAPALPCPASGIERADFRRATNRTNYAVRPTPDGDVVDAVVRIREVDNPFLKARRFLVHLRSPLAKMYQKHMGESSKLLPLFV